MNRRSIALFSLSLCCGVFIVFLMLVMNHVVEPFCLPLEKSC
jgi:hypothetical protein